MQILKSKTQIEYGTPHLWISVLRLGHVDDTYRAVTNQKAEGNFSCSPC